MPAVRSPQPRTRAQAQTLNPPPDLPPDPAALPPGLLEGGDPSAGGSPGDRLPHDDFNLEAQITEILSNEDAETVTLEIYKRDRITKKYGYVRSMTFDEWTKEDGKRYIAETFGGGEYRGRIRRAGGFYGRSFAFTIDDSVRPTPAKEGPAVSSEVAALKAELEALRRSKSNEDLTQNSLMQIMQQNSERMIAMQQEQSKQQLALFTALLTRPPAPGPSDSLMQILLTKALAPAPAPAFDLEKMIGAVTKLASITSGKGSKDDDEGDGIMNLIGKALPLVANLLQAAQGGQGAQPSQGHSPSLPPAPAQERPMVRVDPAAPPVNSPDPAAPAPPDEHAPDLPANLKTSLAQSLPLIVAQAVMGETAESVAARVSEGLPDAEFESLCALLQRPDWLAILIDAHEPVQRHSVWFNALRDALLSELEPAPADFEAQS